MKVRITSSEHDVEATLLSPAAEKALEQISLTITWDGNRPASLVELRDNSQRVPIVVTRGTGRIEVRYESPASGAHYIECKLEFPGRTLKDLKLEGSLGNAASRTIDSDEECAGMWRAEGPLS